MRVGSVSIGDSNHQFGKLSTPCMSCLFLSRILFNAGMYLLRTLFSVGRIWLETFSFHSCSN